MMDILDDKESKTGRLLDDERDEKPPQGNLKSDSKIRWLILMLSCSAMIGNYYCFDNPAALKTQLSAYVNIDETQFNLLYTVYSIPNIFLPFFGGYLCDRLGASFAFALFAASLVAGQVCFDPHLFTLNNGRQA